ncbi:hypothetical protein E2C01_077530 [Portunus trituberculatus]|uniref:Uncharacterized protein n=1 Tax=Portunus trituberculatus TaxID=210409 RepID=A0A5B7IKI0_PORTR|nr:hypothetical protein [Portunus trituberculatus]
MTPNSTSRTAPDLHALPPPCPINSVNWNHRSFMKPAPLATLTTITTIVTHHVRHLSPLEVSLSPSSLTLASPHARLSH